MKPTFLSSRPSLARIVPGACLLLAAPLASAHTGLHASGIGGAFLHPFTGLDHVLAMLAVGAWAVVARRRGGGVPLAFVAAAIVGALAGAGGSVVPALESLLAMSVVAGGAVLCRGIRTTSPALLAAVAAVIGLLHGNAHGLEVVAAASAGSLAAFAAGTALLHAVGYVVARGLAAQTPRALPLAGAVLVCTGGALAFA